MDIEGLGEKNVDLLFSRGLIERFEDIYKLTKDDLLKLPRFADKSAQNLIDAIVRSKETTLSRFLFAIGILHVGEYVARLLARHFPALPDLYRVKKERILEIKQIGDKIASAVSAFFNDERNVETIEALISLGVNAANPDFTGQLEEEGELEGMSFVITGTLPVPRKEAEELIEKRGGRVSSSISANTTYLVVGENPGSKLTRAGALGVKRISYDELLRRIRKEQTGGAFS